LAESIGIRLKAMRERRDWTLRKCADEYLTSGIKCSHQLVRNWEEGNPPLDRIDKLSVFWDVPTHWLLTGIALKGDFEDETYRQFVTLNERDKTIIKDLINRMQDGDVNDRERENG
jgi:transcriptional regulator with XRE-family HTH domain